MRETTEFYRHFDKEGHLLYVGISISSAIRWTQHKGRSEWAKLSVRMEIERFPTRTEALIAEARAIATEKPIYNKMRAMVVKTREKRVLYDDVAAYQAVMDRIRNKVPHIAPQPWLAAKLNLSRQVVYFWKDKGFPVKHAEEISELVDMDPPMVCPSLMTLYLPEDIFNAILARTTPKKPFNVVLVEIIERGLEFERTATRHGKRKSAPLTKTPHEQPMKPIGGFIPISADELANQREEARKAGADLSIRGRSK